jgi:hypothetical protein
MDMNALLLEFVIVQVVAITVLYATVITYKLPIVSIVGVNVLLGLIIGIVHHYMMTMNPTPSAIAAGTNFSTILDDALAMFIVGIAVLVVTFIILTTRFSFVESFGIVLVQGIICTVLNAILGLYRTPSSPPVPVLRRRYH